MGAVVRLIDYGGGNVELVSFLPVLGRKKECARRRKFSDAERDANRRRAVRRARMEARRHVICAGLDHLLTLTTRLAVVDPSVAWRMWARLARLIRDDLMLPEHWPYVAVLEWQQRGALHWHAALRGRQNVNRLRRHWLKVVAEFGLEGGGNLDVQFRRGGDNVAMARYLAKYVGKELDGGTASLGAHRYRTSLGINVPARRVRVTWTDLRQAVEGVAQLLDITLTNLLPVEEQGVTFAIWATSWGRGRAPPRSGE
jgi:hypothetical protein